MAALWSPRSANAPADERERTIAARAGHLSGMVLGAGIIASLGAYLVGFGGHVLFHSVVASLVAGHMSEYLIQIYLFRNAV